MVVLLLLLCHLWGGASGVKQEVHQPQSSAWWPSLSREPAAVQALPHRRPLSRYAGSNAESVVMTTADMTDRS